MKGDNQHCAYCGCRVYPRGSQEAIARPQSMGTKDHVIPQLFVTSMDKRPKAGTNTVVACTLCNNIKNDAPAEIFRFFLEANRGKPAFNNSNFRRLLYALSVVGFRTVFADALSRREAPVPPSEKSTYTLRDLRRRTPPGRYVGTK